MNNTDSDTDSIDKLFAKARAEEPFGAPREYGFAARLSESIRSANTDLGTIDFFSTLCWRFSLVCLPVTVGAMIVGAIMSSGNIPSGMSEALAICSDYIRPDSLLFF